MKELLNRYIWIVDMLTRYGKLSRAEINELWINSRLSDGNPIPERTFYNYRRGIENSLNIDLACDRDGKYFINNTTASNPFIVNWLVEAYSVNNAIHDSSIPTDRISIEEVPSARDYLPAILSAISDKTKLMFTYGGFSRLKPDSNIVFHPCFVKRYKQRWYMVGIREKSGDIRTYALDRIKKMTTLSQHFEMPELKPSDFFENLIGVTISKGDVRTVRIMTTPTQAKYFRALPFHHTQEEVIHDNYSIFTYRLKINYELVHELLSFGDSLKVLSPKELVQQVSDQLRGTLRLYETPESIPGMESGGKE